MAAVIIARKIGLMVAFFAFEGQESWLLAILVIVIALMAHVAVRPFEAPLTDMTETFSLVANLILLVSVPVYAVLQDSADTGRAVRIVWFLEGWPCRSFWPSASSPATRRATSSGRSHSEEA